MKPTYEELLQQIAELEKNKTLKSTIEQSQAAQENLHKILLENLPLEIAIYDDAGKFIYANENTDKLLHKEKGGVIGKSFYDLFQKETADEQTKCLKLVFKTCQPLTVDRNFMLNGRMVHFKILHQPIFNEKGDVNSVLVIGQNVTEQARQEFLFTIQHKIDSLSNLTASLTSSLKKAFQSLLKIDWVDAGGVYLFDEKRKSLRLVYSVGLSQDYLKNISIFSSNDAAAQAVLKGKPMYDHTRTFLEPIKNIMIKEGLSFAVSIPLQYKKQVIGSLNIGSRQVSDINRQDKLIIESIASRLANLIVLVKTRDELFSTNLKLFRSIRQLEEKQQLLIQKSRLESLGELSAGLAHEITQPLSVISLVMENISDKLQHNEASEEYLSGKFTTVSHNIGNIRQLIDHVRIFSRDQGIIMFEKIDVNNVIKGALSMIGTQLRNHQINIKTNLSDNLGYTLGNSSRLEQVILNLLSNSRDAIEEREVKTGKIEKEIVIETFAKDSQILISVRDNGAGIGEEHLEKIFNPFFSTKSEGKGTGLGLAIVYGIIAEMKGKIKVRSEKMDFTEIRIELPGYNNSS